MAFGLLSVAGISDVVGRFASLDVAASILLVRDHLLSMYIAE